jgi:acyl transferase
VTSLAYEEIRVDHPESDPASLHRGFLIHAGDDQRIFTIVTRTPRDRCRGLVLIVPPYAMNAHEFCLLNYYLIENGFTVVRFDAIDNVGLSSGTIEHYALGRLEDDLALVVRLCEAEHSIGASGSLPVILVAQSLSLPVALRHAITGRVARVVSVLGAVNVRDTLERVSKRSAEPYLAHRPDVDTHVRMFGHPVLAQPFVDDALERQYFFLDDVLRDLERLPVPLAMIVSDTDEYVQFSDAERCRPRAERAGSGGFLVVSALSHMVGRSVAAAKQLSVLTVQCVSGAIPDTEPSTFPKLTHVVRFASSEAGFINECERQIYGASVVAASAPARSIAASHAMGGQA